MYQYDKWLRFQLNTFKQQYLSFQGCEEALWAPEYASYCIEGTPSHPYGEIARSGSLVLFLFVFGALGHCFKH